MTRTTKDEAVDPAYFKAQVTKGVSEAELQEWVIDLARLLGWQVRHIHDARGQDVAGLPDLLLWHPERLRFIWAELKTEKGKLTKSHIGSHGKPVEGQVETIEALRACGQVVFVWRPSDWQSGEIERMLGWL